MTYNHSVCLGSWRKLRTFDLRAVQRGGKGFYFGRTSVYKFTSARQKQNETMQQYYSAMKDA